MSSKIVQVTDLSVKFNHHTILKHLNFTVDRDSTVAVVGPNGSGKTVLFKSLLNLIKYSGEVSWSSDAKIGYVPQKLSVQKDLPLTVLDFLLLKGVSNKRISEVLLMVGFKAKGATKHVHHDMRVLNTRLGSLSGGEMQRVLMAYALLDSPNVLLLDEPTAGVDIAGEHTFYGLFSSLKKDKDLTIIFISHDHEVVEKYADQVIKLNHDHEH